MNVSERASWAGAANSAPGSALSPSPGGLVGRFLRDPGGWTHRLTHRLLGDLAGWGRAAIVPAIVLGVLALVAGLLRLLAGRRAVAAVEAGAVVWIRPPDQPDLQAAQAFWASVGEHLSARRSWAARRPVVQWLVLADDRGARLGLHVSPTVNPDAMCRIVSAAWPGRPQLSNSPRRCGSRGRR